MADGGKCYEDREGTVTRIKCQGGEELFQFRVVSVNLSEKMTAEQTPD